MQEQLDKLKAFFSDGNNLTLTYILIGLVSLVIIGITLLFAYIRANMFFVFMESLIQNDISILKSFNKTKGKGFSLFSFNLIAGILLLIIMVIIFIPLGLHIWQMAKTPSPTPAIWPIILNFSLSFIVFFIVLIIASIIYSMTYDFAAAIAYAKDKCIIGGWTELTKLLMANPLEFLIYYLLKTGLAIGTGLAMSLLMIPALLILIPIYAILLIIMVLLIILIVMLLIKMPVLGVIASVIGLIFLFVLGIMLGYVFACPFVPFHAFFRYYSLCFMKRFDLEFNFSEEFDPPSNEEEFIPDMEPDTEGETPNTDMQ